MKVQSPKAYYLEKGVDYVRKNGNNLHLKFLESNKDWLHSEKIYRYLLSKFIDNHLKLINSNLYFKQIPKDHIYLTALYWMHVDYSNDEPKMTLINRIKLKCTLLKHRNRLLTFILFNAVLPTAFAILMVSKLKPHILWTTLYYISTIEVWIRLLKKKK